MKKFAVWTLIAIVGLGTLTGCQKKTICDWCGEKKVCKEYEDGDETGRICEDCQKELLEFLE